MYILTHEDIIRFEEEFRKAQEEGVSEELRGWNWRSPPLKPAFSVRLPNYLVASNYCATARDVYVSKVLNVKPKETEPISAGVSLHKLVYEVFESIMEAGRPAPFEELSKKISGNAEFLKAAYDYTALSAMASVSEMRAKFPFAPLKDLIRVSLPFVLELKVDGSFIGLTKNLSIDAFDYMRRIVFDLKYLRPESKPEPWRRLYVTGYAITLEALYSIPFDVGCLVYVQYNGSLSVTRDIFFISDDLRREWIEERDRKLEIVASRVDPGLPRTCYDPCPYSYYCLRGKLG